MRRFLRGLTVAAGIGVSLAAQVRPTQEQQQAIHTVEEAFAQKKAEELAWRSTVYLGSLSPEGNRAIWRWDLAVRAWKKERGAGPGPLLAEGVLFDCLSRYHGIVTRLVSTEQGVPYFADLAAKRPARAAKAFDAALKFDPALPEARFRRARIRALTDAAARRELETLGTGSFGVLSYLAAMSRAEAAHGLDDSEGARRWYARAVELMPGAPAPHFGLASLGPPRSLPFETLQSIDPYYSYPCTVLTESVDAELSARVAAVTTK